MVWALGLLAASPQLHAALHSDAQHVEHTCAITLFSHGVDEVSGCGELVAAPALFPAGECVVQAAVEVADSEYRLPPGCGPPLC